MFVLALAMVKNEEDVIEAFVRHTLGFADALAVIENGSVDATPSILAALQREGLPLIIFDDPGFAYFQAEKTTALLRRVAGIFRPDAVFLLDADEFVVPGDRAAVQRALSALAPGEVGHLPWRNYVPAPDDADLPFDPPRRIRHRREHREATEWYKAVLRGGPEGYGHLFVEQGNHDVQGPYGRLRARRIEDLALAHFPVRDALQLEGKAVVGWLANLARQRHRGSSNAASQWRALYEAALEGTPTDAITLANHALAYSDDSGRPARWPDGVVPDPIAVDYAIRHAPARRMGTLARTARSVELMLAQDPGSPPPPRPRRSRWQKLLRLLPRKLQPAGRVAAAAKVALPPPAGEAIDLPPLAFLARRHAPRSVLELGGRHDAHLGFLRENGAERLLRHDPARPLDHGESFDLVLCNEASAAALASAAEHAASRILLFPAPAGTDAMARLATLGWQPDLFETLAVRSLASLPALRQGLLVLRRGASEATRARLAAPAPCRAVALPSGPVTEPMTAMLAEWAAAEGAG
jgi:hypothetical protein